MWTFMADELTMFAESVNVQTEPIESDPTKEDVVTTSVEDPTVHLESDLNEEDTTTTNELTEGLNGELDANALANLNDPPQMYGEDPVPTDELPQTYGEGSVTTDLSQSGETPSDTVTASAKPASALKSLKANADFVNAVVDTQPTFNEGAIQGSVEQQETDTEDVLDKAAQLKEEMAQITMETLVGFQFIDSNNEPMDTRKYGEINIELLEIADIKGATKRSRLDNGDIEGLRESIRKYGQLTPIHVTKLGSTYVLLNGMRRLEAIKGIGSTKVLAVVDTTIPPELVKYYDVIVNQSKPYTFTESLTYGKQFKADQPSIGYETIENALGYLSGEFLKALYIEYHQEQYPQFYQQVEQGKLTISQAMKKLEKEIEKAEKDATQGIDDLNSGALDDQLRNKDELALATPNSDAGSQSVGDRKTLDPVLRRSIESRDEGHCQCCGFGRGEPDFMGVFQVHHIIPVMYGGSDNKTNLILLCNNCHTLVHDYERARFLPEADTYGKYLSVKSIVVLGNMLQQLRKEALAELKRNHIEIFRQVSAGKLGLGKAIAKAKIQLNGEEKFGSSPYQVFKDVTADLKFGGSVKGDLGVLNTAEDPEPALDVTETTEEVPLTWETNAPQTEPVLNDDTHGGIPAQHIAEPAATTLGTTSTENLDETSITNGEVEDQ